MARDPRASIFIQKGEPMKKNLRKLVLRRETIQQLGVVQGGASKFDCPSDLVQCPPSGTTCNSCFHCTFTCDGTLKCV